MREVLNAEPEPWQIVVLHWYDSGERKISVRSGHGVGKSTVLAWIMLHHALCHFPQKTVCTAPTSSQLWDALWAEMLTWHKKLPAHLQALLEPKGERVELVTAREESFISARTSRAEQPEALQGIHSSSGSVLLIADEASGIPERVFEAAYGSMSGPNAIIILTGNPVRGQGFFFDTHAKNANNWKTLTVSVFESRWSGGQKYADEIASEWGENSNAYRVRVLGLPPVSDDDTVIPFDLVEAALTRDVLPIKTAIVWGVDVARFGSDRSALAKRRGNALMEPVRAWSKLDTMEVAGRIKLEWDTTPQDLRPAEINVDSIGIGAGVVDRLRELNLPARGINVSESPAIDKDVYRDQRAELYFKMRNWFAARDCLLPDYYKKPERGNDLVRELTLPRYKYTPQSRKLMIESKDDMKKRGMPSPDLAEAFMLTFASDAITLQAGSYGSTSWRTKISRPLKGIV